MGPNTCERQHGWAKGGVILGRRLDEALTEPPESSETGMALLGRNGPASAMTHWTWNPPGKGRLLGEVPLRR